MKTKLRSIRTIVLTLGLTLLVIMQIVSTTDLMTRAANKKGETLGFGELDASDRALLVLTALRRERILLGVTLTE